MVVQLVVLYAPQGPGADTGALPLDKLIHVLVFALPTAALIRAGVPRRWVVAAMVGHAFASEVIQGALLEGRSGDPGDVLADLIGVLIGSAVSRGHAQDQPKVKA